ncbi:hypothetical protein D3C81_1402410 [compost metagenome]
MWVEQVARRVEGEALFLAKIARFQQSANRVVAVIGVTPVQIIDVGELAADVVLIVAHRHAPGGATAGQGLLLQLAVRGPGLALNQTVALLAANFPMQVVALVAEQFVLIELEAEQVTAAIGEPADPVAIRPGGRDTQVEGVVLMLEDSDLRFLHVLEVLVLAGVVARQVVEPLQLAGLVLGK